LGKSTDARSDPVEIAGRYQVVKKLGAGAFGTVYKAKDAVLGRMVAIKTIRLEGLAAAAAGLDELMDRFKREAQVSAQLKHPNIVTIYDVGDSDGVSYLAMEFIDGVGLDRLIASAGRLPLERAAVLVAQVADALDFAHKHNVVHRDIKPANVMVEAGDRVKVTDFGIAKVTDSAEHLTVTGSLLGTPSYMSPEQARGGAVDGRSDLFSVGCVLYEMLTGKKAFRGDSITGLIFKIITEEPPPLRDEVGDVPDEFVRIIAKAMSKAPETRYQSGRELSDDLLALAGPGSAPTLRQSEMGTAAGPPPTPTVISSPTVSGASPTRVSPPAAPPPPRPPSPPMRSGRVPAAARGAEPARRGGGGLGLVIGLLLAVGLLVVLGAGGVWWFVFRDKGPKLAQDDLTPPQTLVPPATQPPASLSSETPPDTLPPVTPETQPAASLPSEPPDTRPPVTQPPVRENRTRPPVVPDTPPSNGGEYAFLDEEAPEMDGGAAGRRVADAFRNQQGGQTSGWRTNTPLNARPRSPRNLSMPERPAVATLRALINREEAYKRKNGRYGTLPELKTAGLLPLDVPLQAAGFARKGYEFGLRLEGDGFTATAMPKSMGPRSFYGTDSGFILEGLE
jgi:serine/threonine protein kinase